MATAHTGPTTAADDPFGDALFDPSQELEAQQAAYDASQALNAYDSLYPPHGAGGGNGANDGFDAVQQEMDAQHAQDLAAADQEREMRAQRDAQANAAAKAARAALIDRLNPRQKEAVLMPPRSALVLAAAGSGKTSVLTARIAQLITSGVGSGPLSPKAVLAVTFTNKAAQEMRTRLKSLLDWRQVNDLWVGTFHSLCNRILRENHKAAGLPRTFAILDVDAQEAMCRGVLKDMGLTRATVKAAVKAAAVSAQQSLLQDEDGTADAATRMAAAGALSASDTQDTGDAGAEEFVTPAQCASYISSRKEAGEPPRPPRNAVSVRSSDIEQKEAVYDEYVKRCAAAGLLDFQDLLTRTVELLRSDRTVRDQLRQRFQAILVDEFQDTNAIQYEWLQLLKGPKAHVMAVGDDDQSIYAFRGARPQNMAQFLGEMAANPDGTPGTLIRLEQNYRSVPYVLHVANAVIENNTERLGKVLRTDKPEDGARADLVHYPSGIAEASTIAQAIHQLVRQENVPPSEIAILYRTNQQSRLFESELNKRGIPLTVYGGFRFYERQEVKHAMAYLDLVNDIGHDISFARVANFPPRGLGDRTIEELRQDAQLRGCTMMAMVAQREQWLQENPNALGGAAALKKQVALAGFAQVILDLADFAGKSTLPELVSRVLDKSGLLAHYTAEDAESADGEGERVGNLTELVSAARQFLIDNPHIAEMDAVAQLSEYLAHVALMTSTSESDMHAKQTVSLMTVHSSKGLEFDHVWVTGLEEKTFPHARAIEEDVTHVPTPDAAAQMAKLLGRDEAAQAAAAQRAGQRRAAEPDGPAIQEERRLLYVAITRARKGLALSHCAQRMSNGDIKSCTPSRFLQELPQEHVRHVDLTRRPQQSSLKFADRPDHNRSAAAPVALSPVERALEMSRQAGRGPAAAAPSRAAPGSHGTHAEIRLAIVGTAGRDRELQHLMTGELWDSMFEDARMRLDALQRANPGTSVRLVSGGAAWADHLAVMLYLQGHAEALSLYLPAPLEPVIPGQQLDLGARRPGFVSPADRSAGSATNWYHHLFSLATDMDSIAQIRDAAAMGAQVHSEPAAPSYTPLFRRNAKVAADCTHLLAYTWGDGQTPVDGGTLDTWRASAHAQREHVGLAGLRPSASESQSQPQDSQAQSGASATPRDRMRA